MPGGPVGAVGDWERAQLSELDRDPNGDGGGICRHHNFGQASAPATVAPDCALWQVSQSVLSDGRVDTVAWEPCLPSIARALGRELEQPLVAPGPKRGHPPQQCEDWGPCKRRENLFNSSMVTRNLSRN